MSERREDRLWRQQVELAEEAHEALRAENERLKTVLQAHENPNPQCSEDGMPATYISTPSLSSLRAENGALKIEARKWLDEAQVIHDKRCDAEDAIAALRAENERLRSALREARDMIERGWGDEDAAVERIDAALKEIDPPR